MYFLRGRGALVERLNSTPADATCFFGEKSLFLVSKCDQATRLITVLRYTMYRIYTITLFRCLYSDMFILVAQKQPNSQLYTYIRGQSLVIAPVPHTQIRHQSNMAWYQWERRWPRGQIVILWAVTLPSVALYRRQIVVLDSRRGVPHVLFNSPRRKNALPIIFVTRLLDSASSHADTLSAQNNDISRPGVKSGNIRPPPPPDVLPFHNYMLRSQNPLIPPRIYPPFLLLYAVTLRLPLATGCNVPSTVVSKKNYNLFSLYTVSCGTTKCHNGVFTAWHS